MCHTDNMVPAVGTFAASSFTGAYFLPVMLCVCVRRCNGKLTRDAMCVCVCMRNSWTEIDVDFPEFICHESVRHFGRHDFKYALV